MPQSYDGTLSLHLDRLIIQLEAGPPAIHRFALRLATRYFERRVPAFGKAGAR